MISEQAEPSGANRAPTIARWLPWILLVVLISVISAGVYRKAYSAKIPPVFDAFSYYAKAFNVWKEVQAGNPERVFSAAPTARPPGTVLLSAPFGLRDAQHDFKSFLFHSIMVPVWVWGTAAALLLIPATRGLSGAWLTASAIGSLMSIPMFYQMEWTEGIARSYSWGFQDAGLAAVAALGLALMLASVRPSATWMSLFGGLLAAWTIFVKPAGLLLMPLICGQWLVAFVIHHWPLTRTWRQADRRLRRYAIATIAALPALFVTAAWISFHSPYLSDETWQAATKARDVLLQLTSNWKLADYLGQTRWPMGYLWSVVLALCLVWSLVGALRLLLRRGTCTDWFLVYALVGFSGGVVWWARMAGPLDRYLFPFLLCFFLAVFPLLYATLQRKLPPSAKSILAGCLFVAPLTLAVLVSLKAPPESMQRFFRINLTSGGFEDCVQTAETLLAHVDSPEGIIRLYKPDQSWISGFVDACLMIRELEDERTPNLEIRAPLDWNRPLMVRRADLRASDFILFERLKNPNAVLERKSLPNGHAEIESLTAWLGQLTPAEGIQSLQQQGRLCLLKISDTAKLENAFNRWMDEREFRPEFYAENRAPLTTE